MSGDLTKEFLRTVARARAEKNSQLLSNCLLLLPFDIANNGLMLSLRQELVVASNSNPNFIDLRSNEILGDEWVGFTDMVAGYLTYIRNLDLEIMQREDPREMNQWLSALGILMAQIAAAWSSPQGLLVMSVVKVSANILAGLAMRIDTLTGNPRKPAANQAVGLILRAFNTTLGDKSPNGLGKKQAAIHLANVLFKLYFRIDQLSLCQTIMTNLKNAKLLALLPIAFPKSQQCTYNYYLGRYYLYKSKDTAYLIPAFDALSKAYSLCLVNAHSQLREILVYLLTAGILVGKMPSRQVWSRPEAHGLMEIFHPIADAVRKGDFRSFRNELRRNGPWLKSKGLYLLLWCGCEDLLWRDLARKCFLIGQENQQALAASNPQAPQPVTKGPPPTLSLHELQHLANWSHAVNPWESRDPRGEVMFSEGEEFTMDEIEGVILNLIEQGLIKGYVARHKMVVVLKRGDGQGFVHVEEARRWKAKQSGPDIDEGNIEMGNGGGVIRLSGLRTIGM